MNARQPRRSARKNLRPRQNRGWARPAQMALVAMGGVLLIYAQAVAALGVGEPRYLSHLFEPLRVDVPVDTRGVDPAAVKVGISFSGVDPAAAAAIESQLHREWRTDGRGGYVLRITTDQPINEPLMQMRVEVGDNQIQAIRDLTLLFDPAPVELPAASLLAEAATPAAPDAAAVIEPIAIAAPAQPVVEVSAAEPIAISRVAPVATAVVSAVPVVVAPSPRAAVAEPQRAAPVPTNPASAVVAPTLKAPAVAVAAANGPVVIARPTLIASPTLTKPTVKPVAALVAAVPVAVSEAPQITSAEALDAQIATTRREQALSGADRWQRLAVAEGDTLDSLAERARGEQTAIPLSMVAMLLRWLNPRSFDGVGSEPLVGAELRFPKPESLAAQIAVSGGVWTVDDVTATTGDIASTVPPPSFQRLTPLSAESLALAMQTGSPSAADGSIAMAAGSALLAARPTTSTGLSAVLSGGRAAGGGLAASTGLVGGAVLAGVLSMMLMLKMVVGTPAPQASRYVPAAVVARSVSTPVPAAARVLPAESLDLASLDLGELRQAETVRQRTES